MKIERANSSAGRVVFSVARTVFRVHRDTEQSRALVLTYGAAPGACAVFASDAYHRSLPPVEAQYKLTLFYQTVPNRKRAVRS